MKMVIFHLVLLSVPNETCPILLLSTGRCVTVRKILAVSCPDGLMEQGAAQQELLT